MSNHNAPNAARRHPQFRLRTLLIAVTAAAAWLACFQLVRNTQRMRAELPGLRQSVRELTVRDQTQYAVIHRPQYWADENSWDVHLPAGGAYRLNFACEGIKGAGVTAPLRSLQLSPGTHSITFTKTKTDDGLLFALRRGEQVVEAKCVDHSDGSGRSSSRGRYEETRQQTTSRPLVLRRLRLSLKGITPYNDEPAKGELVWIEKVDP